MKREEFVKQKIKESGYNMKEFAKEIDMPYTTLLSIVNNSIGGAALDNVFKICSKLGIPADILDNPTQELILKEKDFVDKYQKLDVHGKKIVDLVLNEEYERISEMEGSIQLMYYPNLIVGDIDERGDKTSEYINIYPNKKNKKADFVICVHGMAMEPTYYDGDKLYVAQCSNIKRGEVGVFKVNNVCIIRELGEHKLLAHNKIISDIPIGQDVMCIGRVLCKME